MKLNITMAAPTNDDGSIDETKVAPRQASGGGGSLSYAPFQAGFHMAIVRELKEKTYRAGYGSHKNPDSADGKWDYYGLTPTLHIPHYSQATEKVEMTVNGEAVVKDQTVNVLDYTSVVNRQDLTMGVIKNDALYRVGEDGKNPMFRGNGGTYDMLQALGLFQLEGTNVVINEDLTEVRNRVVWVATQYEAYARRTDGKWSDEELANIGRVSRKGDTVNLDSEQFLNWLENEAMNEIEVDSEVANAWMAWESADDKVRALSKFPIEHIFAIVDAYNHLMQDEIGSIEDGNGIRIKSVVTYWAGLKEDDAEKHGYFYDNGRVFVSKDDYDTAVGMAALPKGGSDSFEML